MFKVHRYRHAFPIVLVLGSAACTAAPASPEVGGGNDLETVSVAVIPIVDVAPLYLGDELGYFEKEGLSLELHSLTGGAAAVPGVVAGDFDFAFGNMVSVMVARDRGLDLSFVSPGSATSGEKDTDYTAVIVNDDSPIKTVADLTGKTVSVNNLSNIGDTTIRYAIERGGGDPDSVKFVEVPFPDVEAALDSDQVDAAWSNEPFLTQSVQNGDRVVAYNYAETHEELDAAGYFALTKYAKEQPETVEKFSRAMMKANAFAQENPAEVRRIVGSYTKISPELRETMVLPDFPPVFSHNAAQTLGKAAVEYSTLEKAPDLGGLLPSE